MQFLAASLVKYLRPRGDDDFIDRLNYYYTAIAIACASVIVTAKQYVMQPLQCWIPTQFTRSMEQYIESYCWMQNTYWVPMHAHVPDEYSSREARQIGYYQWVPFILLVESLLFTMPCLMWRLMNWQTGVNLGALVGNAMEASGADVQYRARAVKAMARNLIDTLDLQSGLALQLREGIIPGPGNRSQVRLWQRYNGRYITLLYLFIKIVYVLNVIFQFFLLNAFLQGDMYSLYGIEVLRDLLAGKEWTESGHFPRVTLCDFEIRSVANLNRYTVQCALLINLFNEKVFAIIWLWLFFLCGITTCSAIFWMVNSLLASQRREFVLRFVHIAAANAAAHPRSTAQRQNSHWDKFYPSAYDHMSYMASNKVYRQFVDRFLRCDGVFVLRMLCNHVGDVITLDVVRQLWREYRYRCNLEIELVNERGKDKCPEDSKTESVIDVDLDKNDIPLSAKQAKSIDKDDEHPPNYEISYA